MRYAGDSPAVDAMILQEQHEKYYGPRTRKDKPMCKVSHTPKVIIKVRGGIAYVSSKPVGVEVEIIYYDYEPGGGCIEEYEAKDNIEDNHKEPIGGML